MPPFPTEGRRAGSPPRARGLRVTCVCHKVSASESSSGGRWGEASWPLHEASSLLPSAPDVAFRVWIMSLLPGVWASGSPVQGLACRPAPTSVNTCVGSATRYHRRDCRTQKADNNARLVLCGKGVLPLLSVCQFLEKTRDGCSLTLVAESRSGRGTDARWVGAWPGGPPGGERKCRGGAAV